MYSNLKNIDAVMAEKLVLQAKIAQKENKIARDYDSIKTYYSNKFRWFSIGKSLVLNSGLFSSTLKKYSLGYKLISYVIKKFKR
jgi:hypothetical protein